MPALEEIPGGATSKPNALSTPNNGLSSENSTHRYSLRERKAKIPQHPLAQKYRLPPHLLEPVVPARTSPKGETDVAPEVPDTGTSIEEGYPGVSRDVYGVSQEGVMRQNQRKRVYYRTQKTKLSLLYRSIA